MGTKLAATAIFTVAGLTVQAQSQLVIRGALVTDITNQLPAELRDTNALIRSFQSSPGGLVLSMGLPSSGTDLIYSGKALYASAAGTAAFKKILAAGDATPQGPVLGFDCVRLGKDQFYFRVLTQPAGQLGTRSGYYGSDFLTVKPFLSPGMKLSTGSELATVDAVNGVFPTASATGALVNMRLLHPDGLPVEWAKAKPVWRVDPAAQTATEVPLLLTPGEAGPGAVPGVVGGVDDLYPGLGENYDPILEDGAGRILGNFGGGVSRFDPATGAAEVLFNGTNKNIAGNPAKQGATMIPDYVTGTLTLGYGMNFPYAFPSGFSKFSNFVMVARDGFQPGVGDALYSANSAKPALWTGSSRFAICYKFGVYSGIPSLLAQETLQTWTPVEGLVTVRTNETLPNPPTQRAVVIYGMATDGAFNIYALYGVEQNQISRLYKFSRVVIDGYTQTGAALTLSGGNFKLAGATATGLLQNGAAMDAAQYTVASNGEIRITMADGTAFGDYKFSLQLTHPAGMVTSNELTVKYQQAPPELISIAPVTSPAPAIAVAPGMAVQIVSRNLCTLPFVADPQPQPWPVALSNCRLTVDSRDVPLRSVTPLADGTTRVEAQLPLGIRAGGVLMGERLMAGLQTDSTTAAVRIPIQATAPFILLNDDGTAQISGPASMAGIGAGDVLMIRATGLGATSPPVPAGKTPDSGVAAGFVARVQAVLRVQTGEQWSSVPLEVVDASLTADGPGVGVVTVRVSAMVSPTGPDGFLSVSAAGVASPEVAVNLRMASQQGVSGQ